MEERKIGLMKAFDALLNRLEKRQLAGEPVSLPDFRRHTEERLIPENERLAAQALTRLRDAFSQEELVAIQSDGCELEPHFFDDHNRHLADLCFLRRTVHWAANGEWKDLAEGRLTTSKPEFDRWLDSAFPLLGVDKDVGSNIPAHPISQLVREIKAELPNPAPSLCNVLDAIAACFPHRLPKEQRHEDIMPKLDQHLISKNIDKRGVSVSTFRRAYRMLKDKEAQLAGSA
jgi:hypothetical protein